MKNQTSRIRIIILDNRKILPNIVIIFDAAALVDEFGLFNFNFFKTLTVCFSDAKI